MIKTFKKNQNGGGRIEDLLSLKDNQQVIVLMGEEEICAICLEDCSKVEDNCMIWWCEHVYHKCCMNKLLEYKFPICKSEYNPENISFVFTPSFIITTGINRLFIIT